MQPNVRSPLEPLSTTVIVVALVHLGAGIAVWWLMASAGRPVAPSAKPLLHWISPADFAVKVPSPAVSGAAVTAPPPPAIKPPPPVPKVKPAPAEPAKSAAQPPSMPPAVGRVGGREANKFITLSPVLPEVEGPPAPPMPFKLVPSLLDIAALNERGGTAAPQVDSAALDRVDDAVVDAYLQAWVAPAIGSVPPEQRRARLHVSIGRDGTVTAARMGKSSGSPALDMSVLEAAQQVRKIPVTLPSSLNKERYDLQINFQIE